MNRENLPKSTSCFNYYNLKNLPAHQQKIGAGFGKRSIRDVMEWDMVMGKSPYPWGHNGKHFRYFQK